MGLFQTTWVWLAGDTQIEDLPIPFFCVSANLTRPGAHVHTRGLLARSVLATTRVPGLFPPIGEQGDLLVDGAIADNLPVQCMKSFAYGGRVIASDVAPAAETTAYADYGLVLSGWQHLLRKLIPFNRRNWLVPSLDYILMRTVDYSRSKFVVVYFEFFQGWPDVKIGHIFGSPPSWSAPKLLLGSGL